MLNRQKVTLQILRENGGKASRLHVTKWLFLLAHESPSGGGKSFYQFVPYHYGPFSFTLYQEMSALKRDGYIAEVGDYWQLTPLGSTCTLELPANIRSNTREIARYYGNMSISQLLEVVYKRYPWYTVMAEATEKRAAELSVAKPAIYTLGYEGFLIEGFLDLLMQHGIQRIIDVRNNPTSRRFGFHKTTLSRTSGALGIDYLHFPELGIPSEERISLVTSKQFETLFDQYEHSTLPSQEASVQELGHIMLEKPSTLMCLEADPMSCHRSRLAASIAKITGLSIRDLGWPR